MIEDTLNELIQVLKDTNRLLAENIMAMNGESDAAPIDKSDGSNDSDLPTRDDVRKALTEIDSKDAKAIVAKFSDGKRLSDVNKKDYPKLLHEVEEIKKAA